MYSVRRPKKKVKKENETECVVRSDTIVVRKSALIPVNKKKFVKLFKKTKNGNARLEIYSSKESSVSSFPENIILANDIARIANHASQPYSIVIILKDSNVTLTTDSEESKYNWKKALNSTIFEEQTGCFSINEVYDDLNTQENCVQVWANECIQVDYGKLALFMIIEDGYIMLKDHNEEEVDSWSIKTVRRSGCLPNEFHFETGRRASAGPKYFSFTTTKGNEKKLQSHFDKEVENVKKHSSGNSPDVPKKPQRGISKQVFTRSSVTIGEEDLDIYEDASEVAKEKCSKDKKEEKCNSNTKTEEDEIYFPSALLHLRGKSFEEDENSEDSDKKETSEVNHTDPTEVDHTVPSIQLSRTLSHIQGPQYDLYTLVDKFGNNSFFSITNEDQKDFRTDINNSKSKSLPIEFCKDEKNFPNKSKEIEIFPSFPNLRKSSIPDNQKTKTYLKEEIEEQDTGKQENLDNVNPIHLSSFENINEPLKDTINLRKTCLQTMRLHQTMDHFPEVLEKIYSEADVSTIAVNDRTAKEKYEDVVKSLNLHSSLRMSREDLDNE